MRKNKIQSQPTTISKELPFLNLQVNVEDPQEVDFAFSNQEVIDIIIESAYNAVISTKGDCDIIKLKPFNKKVTVKKKDRSAMISQLINHYTLSENYERCKKLSDLL